MTVRREGSTLLLEGDCPVEDAEVLADLIRDPSTSRIDWRRAERLHTAVLQLVLMSGHNVRGPCGDAFVARWIEPQAVAGSTDHS